MNDVSAAIPSHLMREPQEAQRKNVLGKDDFMRLLMTQLKFQDPLNPKSNEEFAAQLAQFSSLEQLSNIDKGIGELKSGLGAEQRYQALSMIGKEVRANGNRVELEDGKDASLSYLSDATTQPLKAVIFGSNGQLVRELDLSSQRPTDSLIRWDGKDQEGKQLSPGSYSFRVFGVDNKGQSKEMNAELGGQVVGVEMEGTKPLLIVETRTGKSRMELDKVTSVSVGGGSPLPTQSKNAGEGTKSTVQGETVSVPVENAARLDEVGREEGPEEEVTPRSHHYWSFIESNPVGRYR